MRLSTDKIAGNCIQHRHGHPLINDDHSDQTGHSRPSTPLIIVDQPLVMSDPTPTGHGHCDHKPLVMVIADPHPGHR